MGLFTRKYRSMAEGVLVEAPEQDFKNAKRIGQYRISSQAIYKPDGDYLPLSVVTAAVHDKTSVHVSGCCAGGTYVERIIMKTENGKYPFLFDSLREIQKVRDLMPNAVVWEPVS